MAEYLFGVKRHIAIRARRESWAIAVVSLAVFSWLGFAAVRFGSIFDGEVNLPVATRLVFAYGPTAFPLFGVVAAVALILSDTLFHSRWMQWALIVVFALAVICSLVKYASLHFTPERVVLRLLLFILALTANSSRLW